MDKDGEHTFHCSKRNWFWVMSIRLHKELNSADEVLDYLRGVVDARGNRIQSRARAARKPHK